MHIQEVLYNYYMLTYIGLPLEVVYAVFNWQIVSNRVVYITFKLVCRKLPLKVIECDLGH